MAVENKARPVRMDNAPAKDDRPSPQARKVDLGNPDTKGREGRKLPKSVRLGTGGRSRGR